MTTPILDPEVHATAPSAEEEKEERKRRLLLLLLLLLLLAFCCVGYFIIRYIAQPQPLPEMLPQPVAQTINYPPAYKFSITGVDKPVGVAISPDGERIYVAESGGDRLIKIFDRDGNLIKGFFPPGTDSANREPKFLAVDAGGRVFLVDRTANVIDLFDADGDFLDAIIAPDMTLTKFLSLNIPGGLPSGTTFHYEGINHILYYTLPGQPEQSLTVPASALDWSPLGIRFDAQGNLLYTDITVGKHSVHIIPAADLNGDWLTFNPQINEFGVQGKENGQFDFPQIAVTDSRGNFYISDGNNTRISAWSADMQYRSFFGFGSSESALNLPRGMWLDGKDRLHVADAVGSFVRVYDVSGDEPAFLYNFGSFGAAEGQFAYPIDIGIDGTGRLYIADRENNRIQVWSY
jgi:DNA-binding beta-propeller fold protein YncE